MVVEDDPNDQFLIEQAFRKMGVTDPIQVVSIGAQAIANIKPEVDSTGKQLATDGVGKPGERFGQMEYAAGAKPEKQ